MPLLTPTPTHCRYVAEGGGNAILYATNDVPSYFNTYPNVSQIVLQSSRMDIFAKPLWAANQNSEMVKIYPVFTLF